MKLQLRAEHRNPVRRLLEHDVHETVVATPVLAGFDQRSQVAGFQTKQPVVPREEPSCDLLWRTSFGGRERCAAAAQRAQPWRKGIRLRAKVTAAAAELFEKRLRVGVQGRRDAWRQQPDIVIGRDPIGGRRPLRARAVVRGRRPC